MHRIHYTYSATQNRLNGITATGISNSTYKYDPVGNLTDDMGEHLTISWNSSGKVSSVSGNSSPLNFAYSPLGQRQVKGRITDNMKAYDFYIHDATGNIMAIYNLIEQAGSFMLTEEHIYGSGRLGIYKRNVTLTPENEIFFTRGIKNYELSNHLGNVNTVISDRKRQINVLGSYLADIKSYVDYYPFGYQMAERTWQSDAYRFGFNDQEKDDEIYGEGHSTTDEFWQYDTRLGKRWNVDPKSDAFTSYYACFKNNPVCYTDYAGDTIAIKYRKGILGLGKIQTLTYENGKLFNPDKSEYTGKMNNFLNNTVSDLNKIRKGGDVGESLITDLQNDKQTVSIMESYANDYYNLSTNNVYVNPKNQTAGLDVTGKTNAPSYIILAHELIHSWDKTKGGMESGGIWFKTQDGRAISNAEKFATYWENKIRSENNLNLREYYTTTTFAPAKIIDNRGNSLFFNEPVISNKIGLLETKK